MDSQPPLLERLALHRPELRAWAMYDWGNSAFFTTIVAAVFPVYFGTLAAGAMTPQQVTVHYGRITAVALGTIAVLSPLLGAISDYSGSRKRWLGLFLAIGVGATAGMFWIRAGDWLLASWLFVFANIGAAGTMIFYDGLLPHVARADEVDRVSTSAYALGYLGGGLLLAAQLVVIRYPGLIGAADAAADLPTRISLLSVAVWWLVFALPLFRRVPEPPRDDAPRGVNPILGGLRRLGRTARELRRYRHAFCMLLAFLVYGDGIGTVFRMAARFADELHFSRDAIIAALLLTQFVGVPAAVGCGWVAQRVGARRTVLGTLVVYVAACLFASQMRTETHLFLLAGLVALVQGGAQALSRSLFASMVPRARSAEFFGLFAVCDRVAGVAGPLLFAELSAATGDSRIGVAAVALFFVVGGVLLTRVDVAAGRRAARP